MKAWTSLIIVCIFFTTASPAAHAAIVRLSQVAPGILRGSQPETLEDYRLLKAMGVKTLLNLRKDGTVEAERTTALSLGLGFETAPLSGSGYPSKDTVDHALEVLTNPALQPVYVHCRHGKDRTGMIVGLYRTHVDHWSRRAAYREMRRFNFNPMLIGLTIYYWLHSAVP